MTLAELSPDKLRLVCPPDQVGCETSAELGPVEGIIGQDRALKALKFGMERLAVFWKESRRASLFLLTGSMLTISRTLTSPRR